MTEPSVHTDLVARLRTELAAVRPDLDDPASVPADALLKQDLAVDSLDILEFVARVEAALRVIVPDEDWQHVATLNAFATYLGRLEEQKLA